MDLTCHLADPRGLVRIHGKGFFTQHMFAGTGRPERPLDMQIIGQRVVNGFDGRVGQQVFITAVGPGNAEFSRPGLRRAEIARSDGVDAAQLAFLHGRDHFFPADFGRAENAPADFAGHFLDGFVQQVFEKLLSSGYGPGIDIAFQYPRSQTVQ